MKLTRMQRLLRVLQLLRSGRRYNIDALADDLGVSRRTVFRDLSELKDAGVVCQYDADEGKYGIEPSHYLPPVNVTLEEGLALMLLTRHFVNDRVFPLAGAAMSAGWKLESLLPEKVRSYCGRMLEGVSVDWQQVSDTESVADVLGVFQRAVAERRKVAIRYDSYYEREEIDTVIRPYAVTFRRRGWYVIGFSERHREVRMFKLERVLDSATLEATFRPDPSFSLDGYFGNAWHMIPGGRRQHVEVHFSSMVAGNVEEVVWHRTQRTRRRSDGTLVFEADVDGIEEILWWVLGYGDQAIVQEPDALRALVQSHAESMARNYRTGVGVPKSRA